MRVFGVTMVRNEADILRVTLLHHLSLGLERIYVVDNGSTDGTSEVLRDLAAEDDRLQWRRDESDWRQGAVFTEAAREAWKSGADWIVPFDGDEFWWSTGRPFLDVLGEAKAGAVRCEVVNYIQDRRVLKRSPEALLSMTYRVASPAGPAERTPELVESGQIAFVEMMYPPKYIVRPSESLQLATGNHVVSGAAGEEAASAQLRCLHAPLRSLETLRGKVEHGVRAVQAGWPAGDGWHVRRWHRIGLEGGLDQEWAANSHRRGRINVNGEERAMLFDPTLRDVVSPLLPRRRSGVLAWLGGRASLRHSGGGL